MHIIDPAYFCRALDDSIQHWLHICGRTADDAEHFGCGGLVLQCFTQFGVTLLQFLEEPHVLDSNYCLTSEDLKAT